MEDAAALTIVNDVRDVRQDWQQYKSSDNQQQEQWGDAMDIDYESSNEGHGSVKMVIDTNVLLSYLDRLKDISDILREFASTSLLEFVIPGIVLQELDAQAKHSRAAKPELQNLAQAATRWLLNQIKDRKSGKPAVVRMQRDHETYVSDLSWKTSRAISVLSIDMHYERRVTGHTNGHPPSSNGAASYTPPHTPESSRKPLETAVGTGPPLSPTGLSNNIAVDVEMADGNDPRRSLEALHALFLDYLSTYLPAEVISFLTLARSSDRDRRHPSHNGGPPEGWQSWSPQKCLKELQQARPIKRPSKPIEWTCLSAFTAKPGESGYRANGGSVGDWHKAISMLHLVGEAYALDCLNVEALNKLAHLMASAAGLTASV
ncbi:hypothetical protein CALVIDRAFT_554113 [Calocera viscosa TUFC12733]|uniref:PIN domain-containing protein n=1 Tax=Calocera viscosa (strain TUFC12733) TaxID=1330018 RepID=A0A167NSR2_CALVF|nr:hypothetical protein CALVIDRAFT_554113 [Calocera viscosa TUFC12733]